MMDKDTILEQIRGINQPLSFRLLSERLGFSKREARQLKKVLKQLIKEGKIIRTRKGLYGQAEEMSLVTGYFEAHRDGYGFVVLEKPGERDIFIPSRATMGAMDNDMVVVRVENIQRRQGRIIRILKRAFQRVAGIIEVEGKNVYLRPKHMRLPFDISIPPAEKGKAKDGDTVIVEITKYPTENRPPTGRVVKIIKEPGDPKAEIEAIVDEFNVPRRFPSDVIEASNTLLSVGIEDYGTGKTRKDLTGLTTVTIDGERAKDFDDAVSIKLTPEGYKLYVHIADVSNYVDWDDIIDIEARNRATSVYLPDRVSPMLPPSLSEDICSLRPGVKRMTFTVEMDFDRHGNRTGEKFYPSVIQSNERMTYTAVSRIIVDQDPKERTRYNALLGDFELMAELCGVLRKKRLERGSLDFDLPEPEVILDLEGQLEAIIKAERNFAHMLIEEFMIAANEAVAEFIESRGVPSLYRIHEEPDESKMDEILAVVRGVANLQLSHIRSEDLPSILSRIKGTPSEEVINYIILRSLKQARYSVTNVGHFGLASKSYSHFTSPIRRYPDLVVHRVLKDVLIYKKGIPDKKLKAYESVLPDIALNSSRMERIADEAEREVIDAMRAWFMKGRVGDQFGARIVGITPYGMKLRLKEFYIEGFLRVSSMADDYYQYNEKDLSLFGKNTKKQYRIGKDLTVRVDKVDMQEREILFGIV
ncbi:MAG: ribonuclease R [bacterium]